MIAPRAARIAILTASAVAASACWAPPPPAPAHAGTADAAAAGPSPEGRARQIIQTQLDANQLVEGGADARDRAVRETFAADAVISGEDDGRPAAEVDASAFAGVEIADLRAGGDRDAIWFTATFRDARDGADGSDGAAGVAPLPPPSAPRVPTRYAGIATRSKDWKIVAASMVFTPRGDVNGQISAHALSTPNATPATSLTSLVLDGPALARALAADAVVITGDAHVGRGAAALGPWATRALALHADSREVIGEHWATIQANAAVPSRASSPSGELTVLALAVRADSRGSWTPIFVQYLVH